MKQKKRLKRIVCILFGIFIFAIMLVACENSDKNILENVQQLNHSEYTINVDPGSAGAILAEEMFPNANIVYNNAISD